jgi:ABC-type branched-subunit amino acid transport system permease subunit
MCGGLYCFLGYTMVASFSVAAPERKAHWELMAWLYVAGMAVCSLLAVILTMIIFRRRSRTAKGNDVD